MSERPLYYLVSTAGIPNLGDELIAATWVRYLAEHAPGADVVLDCVDPSAVVAPLRSLHPRLRTVSTLWQLCFRNWSAGLGAADAVQAAVADPGQAAADLRDGIGLLRRADVVHLTGGGFLNSMWPAFSGLLSGIAAATEHSGGRAAMTGVGLIPPAAGGEELIRALAARLAVADVRDTASAQLLGDPAALSCDDVFLYPRSWRDEESADLPDVMVSVQFTLRPTALFPPGAAAQAPGAPGSAARERAAQRGMSGLIALVSKAVADWGAREVGVLECWPDADRDVLAATLGALPRARLFTLEDVLRRGFPARPGQAWFSTRFHPHLLAAAAGASGVAVSLRDDYYGTKHRSLTDHGSPWELARCDVLGPQAPQVPQRPAAGGYLPAQLDAHQAAKRQVAERIYGFGPAAGARSDGGGTV